MERERDIANVETLCPLHFGLIHGLRQISTTYLQVYHETLAAGTALLSSSNDDPDFGGPLISWQLEPEISMRQDSASPHCNWSCRF